MLDLAGDPLVGAVLITGPIGIGKSRVAEGAMAGLIERGWRGTGLSATDSAGRIPYASLSELIPDALDALDTGGDGAAELAVLRAVEEALELGDGAPHAIVIDDVAAFDRASSDLLVHLAANRRVFVIASQPLGAGLSEALIRLTPARVVELPIEPLDVTATAELAADVLGGPVGPGLVRELSARTLGNPLFITELLATAASDGRLDDHDGTFQLSGDLELGASLGRLILNRLGAIDADERVVLELLAVAGPLGVDDLADRVGFGVLEEMERRHLIVTWSDRRRLRVRAGHPIHAEAIVADMTPLARRRRHGELLAMLEAHGARRADDHVLTALALLGAGRSVETGALLRAVEQALRSDRVRDAGHLATAAFGADNTESTRAVLAEALIRLGRFVEADALLADPLPDDADEWTRMWRAIRRSSNQLWGFRDAEAAVRLDVACLEGLRDVDAIERVLAHEAWIAYCRGDATRAVEDTQGITDRSHPDVRFAVAAVRAPALVLAGRIADGAQLAERAWEGEWGADTPNGSHGQHLIALGFANLFLGDIAAARLIATEAIASCRHRREVTALLFFLDLAGWTELFAGDAAAALPCFAEAFETAAELSIASSMQSSLAGMAIAEAQLGDGEAAQATWRRASDVPPAPGPRAGAELAQASAWALAASGRTDEAARVLRRSAAELGARGLRPLELLTLLDLARVDRVGQRDAEQAATAAAACQGSLMPAIGTLVGAVVDKDPGRLEDAATRLAELGCALWAAEAAAMAADAAARAGDQRRAAALHRESARWRPAAQVSPTPALTRAPVVDPLTRREREIASLAAGGIKNAEIAERLHVSVRTVETHLQRVYGKLGIRSRAELRRALGR